MPRKIELIVSDELYQQIKQARKRIVQAQPSLTSSITIKNLASVSVLYGLRTAELRVTQQ